MPDIVIIYKLSARKVVSIGVNHTIKSNNVPSFVNIYGL